MRKTGSPGSSVPRTARTAEPTASAERTKGSGRGNSGQLVPTELPRKSTATAAITWSKTWRARWRMSRCPLVRGSKLAGKSARARDDAVAGRLWSVSEELAGVRFDL